MKFDFFLMAEIDPDTFSAAIEAKIGADYSHAGIVVSDIPMPIRLQLGLPLEGDIIFEATVPVYRFITMKAALNEGSGSLIIHRINIPVWDEVGAVMWLKGNMGKRYSWSQVAAMVAPSLSEVASNGEGEGVCSELALRFALECSTWHSHLLHLNPDLVNPKDCLEIFQKIRSQAPSI